MIDDTHVYAVIVMMAITKLIRLKQKSTQSTLNSCVLYKNGEKTKMKIQKINLACLLSLSLSFSE